MVRIRTSGLALAAFMAVSTVALAKTPQVRLQIKNHAFSPAQLNVSAGTKVKLLIHNADSTPAEFESYDLSREVVVPAGGNVIVFIGPLDPGHYGFFNDFYPSATGKVIVTAPGSE